MLCTASGRVLNSSQIRPKFPNCCNNDFVSLPSFFELPNVLDSLFTEQNSSAKTFSKNLRACNSALSVKYVVADWVSRGLGSFTFNPKMTFHGQIYHCIDVLSSPAGNVPTYISTYIHDTEFVSQMVSRIRALTHLQSDLLQSLTAVLHEVSSYVQYFSSLKE